MKPVVALGNLAIVLSSVLFPGVEGSGARTVAATDPAKPDRCTAPEYREFDFWVGDWEVFDVDNPNRLVARTRVDPILDGCVLREDYPDSSGLDGQSQTLTIEGGMQAGEMVLSGVDHAVDGKMRRVRGIWTAVNHEVRETAMTSIDGGETWNPYFDLSFRPVAEATNGAGATPVRSEEQKIVAALDTRYQAAVRTNDADAMGAILADDFVLVTGAGKTYTKADLLNEARGGHVHYERQDDSRQTVRIWGDTAVVTAKLWGKGTDHGKPFDYTLWFSDTYVRTRLGWRYVFGQASSPLSSLRQ